VIRLRRKLMGSAVACAQARDASTVVLGFLSFDLGEKLRPNMYHICAKFGFPGGPPSKVPYMATIYSTAPFEAISTSQDDSRQCEHLLSQEFCASCSDVWNSIST
jgi:hypothetical protein